jgi:hypothetical protein
MKHLVLLCMFVTYSMNYCAEKITYPSNKEIRKFELIVVNKKSPFIDGYSNAHELALAYLGLESIRAAAKGKQIPLFEHAQILKNAEIICNNPITKKQKQEGFAVIAAAVKKEGLSKHIPSVSTKKSSGGKFGTINSIHCT